MSKRKQGRQPPKPPQTAPARPIPRAAAVLFGPAILTSALLLFAVQPLIARYLLPWFGGGPGVWTTCMLFFQALLLGGYLYAHLSVRHLGTRGQVVLHLLLLASALALIPIIPSAQWKPTESQDPVWRILLLLGATIGLPYFVLSATSPLLQAWFAKSQPGVSPYRLFALSNLGSLLALVGYPLILEPLFTRRQQAWIWSIGLIVFAITCVACALYAWRARTPEAAAPTAAEADIRGQKPAVTMLLWLGLPLIASALLLSITNVITEDVGSTPLLWIIPLALYLITFIIAFDSPRWYPRRAMLLMLPVAALWLLRLQWLRGEILLLEQLIGYSFSLFILCLFCHGELARQKPPARDLTRYYLAIAAGGAIGGVFVAVVAPRIFDRLLELPLAVIAASGLCLACLRHDPIPDIKRWAWFFVASAVFLLVGPEVIKPLVLPQYERIVDRSRNFYGTLVVAEFDAGGRGDPRDRMRAMNHGSTSHGSQFLEPDLKRVPTLYYAEPGGAGLTFQNFPRKDNRKVGLVGLGVGTLATYGRPGDTFRFYEIDPDVERLARAHFSFLSDSPTKTEVVLGDARLSLEREDPQAFDILILDAFSGDSIPTHLLTVEAFDLYKRHLAPGGVIAVHISNRSVDLIQVVLRQSERLGTSYAIINHNDPQSGRLLSRWMLLTDNREFLQAPAVYAATRWVNPNPKLKIWTDDHTNLMSVVRLLPQFDAAAKPAAR